MMLAYIFIAVALLSSSVNSQNTSDPNANDELGKTPAEICRLRGFIGIEYYLTTSDGYILQIVRCLNPLYNGGKSGLANRDVLLFFHGILTNAKFFLVNSVGAHPENDCDIDFGQISEADFIVKFESNPNSKSLVFAALNCGHEVFLVSVRGTMYSQGYSGGIDLNIRNNYTSARKKRQTTSSILTSNPLAGAIEEVTQQLSNPSSIANQINPIYWNYTLETISAIDAVETIQRCLEISGRDKLSVIGHSAGGTMILLALYLRPEIGESINKAFLWAPGVEFGATPPAERSPLRQLSLAFRTPLENYIGPVPPSLLNPVLSALAATVCEPKPVADTLCSAAVNFIFGVGEGGADLDQNDVKPGFLSAAPETVGSLELAQFIQFVTSPRTNFFIYQTRQQNIIAYGNPLGRLYDFSKIKFRNLSIYYALNDGFVQYRDTQQLLAQLTVPVENVRFYNDTGLYWNHISYLLHTKVARYLILPVLRQLNI